MTYRIFLLLFLGACTMAPAKEETEVNFLGDRLSQRSYFFVNGSRGNDSWDGSIYKPWKTLARASNVTAGAIVYVNPGTYNEILTPQNSGTVKKQIAYLAEPPCDISLDYKAKPRCGVKVSGINVNGKQHLDITGFETPYVFVQDRYTNTSVGVTVFGNYIHHSPEYGIEARNTKDLRIVQNYISDTVDGGITVRGANTEHALIQRNTILRTGTDGIRPSGHNIVIDENVIGASWEGTTHQDAIEVYNGMNNLIISNNKIFDYTQLVYLNTYDGDLPISGVQIVNNEMWCDAYCAAGNDAPGVMIEPIKAKIWIIEIFGNKFTNLWNYVGDGNAQVTTAYLEMVTIKNNNCSLPRFSVEMHNSFTYQNNVGCQP